MPSPVTSLPPAQESELALSVERAFREVVMLDRLGALWALILAKCCLAQWAIGRFSIPIGGFVYVWTLTLAMAVVASVFYLHAHRVRLRLFPAHLRVGSAVFIGLLVALGFVGYAYLALGALSASVATGLCAALFGAWSLARAALRLAWEPFLGALLWWGFAGSALRGAASDAWLWVGLGFLFAQAVPGFALAARTLRRRRV